MSAIDLSRQVRFGPDFALLKEAGGTGRIDGYTPGLWFPSVASADNAPIVRGQVVKSIQSIGPAFVCTPTTAATDRAIGVALEDIAQNAGSGAIAYAGAPVEVLTTGTIAVHDILYTSGTTGRATATVTPGASIIGMSLNATSGTSGVWAILTIGITSADHGFLTGLSDDDHTQYLKETDVAAKGDIYAASANDTVGVLAVGANGQVLTADSTQSLGVKWGAALASTAETVQKSLTNKSGATVNRGDVVVVDETTNESFTTNTTYDVETSLGIVQETIANNSAGFVALVGYVDLTNTASIAQSRGDYVFASSNAKMVHGSNTRAPGAFGQFLQAGSNSSAWLWGAGDQTAVGGGGGGSIPSGTGFPGGPANNDLFYRTDRDLLYFYDGTRWLTLNLYEASGDAIANVSTTTDIGRWPAKTTINGGVYVETFYLSVFVVTTNNGTNYWNLTAQRVNSANSPTTLGSAVNTSADAVTTWVEKSIAVAAVLDSTARQVQIQASKTGAPGNLYSACSYTYRGIG